MNFSRGWPRGEASIWCARGSMLDPTYTHTHTSTSLLPSPPPQNNSLGGGVSKGHRSDLSWIEPWCRLRHHHHQKFLELARRNHSASALQMQISHKKTQMKNAALGRRIFLKAAVHLEGRPHHRRKRRVQLESRGGVGKGR